MIQVAQIGCGRIARSLDIRGILRNSDEARYVAVCDLDSVRLADAKHLLEEAYAKKFGRAKFWRSRLTAIIAKMPAEQGDRRRLHQHP